LRDNDVKCCQSFTLSIAKVALFCGSLSYGKDVRVIEKVI